ncbi:MAG: hypothetical protein ACR2FY_07415 [Pirellulaceae bacterium]
MAEKKTDQKTGKERRKSVRRKYTVPQLVAEYNGDEMPGQNDFYEFPFHDISAEGVSFLCSVKPRQKQLVIALGNAPFYFWAAEVVFTQRRDDLTDLPYLVGCRLIGRLNR